MTQYQIGHKFPNHDQGRKEALKALLDGVCLKNSYGQITAFINNHFRYWNTLDPGWCLLWDSSLIDRGPWTVVEDPSKPKPKPYSEMTPEEQRARFEEVLGWESFFINPDNYTKARRASIIKAALELGLEIKKGDA